MYRGSINVNKLFKYHYIYFVTYPYALTVGVTEADVVRGAGVEGDRAWPCMAKDIRGAISLTLWLGGGGGVKKVILLIHKYLRVLYKR